MRIYETDFFVGDIHGCLNLNTTDPFSDKNSILWIRGFRADMSYLKDRLLIHGHTPLEREKVVCQSFSGTLNIDGGCVYKYNEGMGNLLRSKILINTLLDISG